MAPTNPNPNAILYLNRTFGINSPFSLSNDEIVSQLTQSGFTTVILFAVNVSADNGGDLYFSGTTPIVSDGAFNQTTFGYLQDIVQGLTASGSTIASVLFSIAGGWPNVSTLLQGTNNLQANFQALQEALGIDGWDFDNEDAPPSVCAQLAPLLSNCGANIITCSPFTQMEEWAAMLGTVYSQNDQTQLISWFNLQCYGGGTGNQPSDWIAAVTSTTDNNTGLDSTQAQAFIIPGFDPITSFNNTLAALGDESPFPTTVSPLAGAFYWGAYSIFMATMNPQFFADAILSTTGTD